MDGFPKPTRNNFRWFCPNFQELILDGLGKLSRIGYGRFGPNRQEPEFPTHISGRFEIV